MNPKFILNLYNNVLFRWHALGDKTFKEPRNSPYYSSDFYSAIRQVVINHPSVSWDRSWFLARLSGLSSEQTSFIFKILQNILPTGSRLHRLKQRESPVCTLCTCGLSDDWVHTFLTCDFNNWVIEFSRKVVPNCSLEDIICLNLQLANPVSFHMIWSLSHVFYTVS